MGYFIRQRSTHYYAIMHKYTGPVFIKPGPMTYSELLKAIKDNRRRDLVLTQVCGQEEKPGLVTFSTYWERVPDVESEYLLSHTSSQPPPTPPSFPLPHIICLSIDQRPYAQFCQGMEKDVLCTAIWEQQPDRKSFVLIEDNLDNMYQNFKRNAEIIPRQISHFIDKRGTVMYVVLWSDMHSNRYPDVDPLWEERTIPVRFLQGTPELLKESQMEFLIERVEHFMRELDIPGLSIAIAKREQLKVGSVSKPITAAAIMHLVDQGKIALEDKLFGAKSIFGFGYADVRKQEIVTPNHQFRYLLGTSAYKCEGNNEVFRVGSVSKPITAAAIMHLVDQGKIALDDKIFGAKSIFGTKFTKRKSYKKYVTDVTVRHLLEHSAGITLIIYERSAGGWDNLQSDPAWIQQNLNTEQLIDYEDYVKTFVFAAAGVHDIQVARPTISQKAPREVLYYMSGNRLGFDPYEMLSADRIGPWGGWIASPIQMLLFMVS
ncbi:unnamed protein product [Strongylus vulgaris]|uniref:Beta-lactamase-related domain-containing protein n=1 Tax=Strongylus vulgaris TaxID=40348 RepID=A0A3P7JM03_STRVU|nr:unnamed protein product [Strongylus vulgaris]